MRTSRRCSLTLHYLLPQASIHWAKTRAYLPLSPLFSAPHAFQELWVAHREPRFARSCIVCTNVAESGITIPNVGLVISSGVQRRVSTDVRTGATVNALANIIESTVAAATRPVRSNRLWNSHNNDEPRSILVSSKVR